MSFNKLFELNEIAKKEVAKYSKKRFIYEDIEKESSKGKRLLTRISAVGKS